MEKDIIKGQGIELFWGFNQGEKEGKVCKAFCFKISRRGAEHAELIKRVIKKGCFLYSYFSTQRDRAHKERKDL